MKQIIILMIVCLLIPLASAQESTFGIFKVNTNISLIISCQNSTYLNISKIIINPSNNVIIDSETVTTKSGSVYNYTISQSNITQMGEYVVYYHCNLDGIDTSSASSFIVNNNGYELTTSRSIILILGLIALVILSLTFFVFGGIIQHLGTKVFLYSMSVVLTVFSFGYGYALTNTLIGEYGELLNSFGTLYTILVYLLIAGGFGLIMFLIALAMDSFNRHRGLKL